MTYTRSTATLVALALASAAASAPAAGQSATDSESFAVVGNVPAICIGGSVSEAGGVFDLGVLVDTSTGFLRTDLTVPAQVLSGSFCSARSSIAVSASPITAQTFTSSAPAGFSRSVDFTATASGWTATPATFATAAASNPSSLQQRDTPFSGPISVGIGSFTTTGGAALRLVADTSYRGTVTVTLTPES
ncbi:hypothetical protein [Novosphingobium taihuense]|uniref:Secreted protein n=1 Tax=Novosphingobium taihuense TaxID=260085 RepID=A0A7W7ETS9_9SPHN|nr:hypothetical protein [Novosphingobium taihuense]MBB4613562.1 hypothetical protein [Novosphingobium taihuense]TWH81194.1 hypothetical protein IQ25_03581 [Novosphingobium taihuense]